jgi:hypothetical protein
MVCERASEANLSDYIRSRSDAKPISLTFSLRNRRGRWGGYGAPVVYSGGYYGGYGYRHGYYGGAYRHGVYSRGAYGHSYHGGYRGGAYHRGHWRR